MGYLTEKLTRDEYNRIEQAIEQYREDNDCEGFDVNVSDIANRIGAYSGDVLDVLYGRATIAEDDTPWEEWDGCLYCDEDDEDGEV